MPKDFYQRLRDYYQRVAEVLRGEAEAASVFPNSGNVGTARERLYERLLRFHAPSKCNVFLGGFLFDEHGNESKQLDVLVTTDTCPRFNFHNQDGSGPAFSPVEGTIAVASIKSTLDKKELEDSLEGLASIPATTSIAHRIPSDMFLSGYDDWPFKIIYATRGIQLRTLLGHLVAYYESNPSIPYCRRPNLIHVAGQYTITRITPAISAKDPLSGIEGEIPIGTFMGSTIDPDLVGIALAVDFIQVRASASSHILFDYSFLLNGMTNGRFYPREVGNPPP